jgi:peptidoglycan hydrolase-like protein with peptidoglycan-binding domain
MDTLKHGDSGLSVEQLQAALNLADLTRLPRLTVDGQFNGFTVARVMEFQSLNGLTVDGVVGPQTNGRLPQAASENQQSSSPPIGRSILADLYGRVLNAYDTRKFGSTDQSDQQRPARLSVNSRHVSDDFPATPPSQQQRIPRQRQYGFFFVLS